MTTSKKREIATSFTTLTFLVIAISGIMMFFHFFGMEVKALHNILGLIFVIAGVFHVIMNWKAMKNYFSKKIFISASLIVTIISAGLIYASSTQGKNPKDILFNKVFTAPNTTSFALLSNNYEEALKRLKEQNINVIENNTIDAIAKANQISPFKIIKIIVDK